MSVSLTAELADSGSTDLSSLLSASAAVAYISFAVSITDSSLVTLAVSRSSEVSSVSADGLCSIVISSLSPASADELVVSPDHFTGYRTKTMSSGSSVSS